MTSINAKSKDKRIGQYKRKTLSILQALILFSLVTPVLGTVQDETRPVDLGKNSSQPSHLHDVSNQLKQGQSFREVLNIVGVMPTAIRLKEIDLSFETQAQWHAPDGCLLTVLFRHLSLTDWGYSCSFRT